MICQSENENSKYLNNINETMKKKELASPILLSIILLSLDMITKYFFYNLEKLNSLSIIRPIINT